MAFIDAAMYSVIRPMARSFPRVRAGVQLSVKELRTPDQIREVAAGRLHAGFVHPQVSDPRLPQPVQNLGYGLSYPVGQIGVCG